MPSFCDLAGQTFGRLTVVERVDNVGKKPRFLCRCECGAEKAVTSNNLVSGHTSSCGCLNKEIVSTAAIKRNFVHGHNKTGRPTPTHNSWANMLKRCRDQNHRSYPDYGGRGIKVCNRWRHFKNFLADMGERPADKTLDRKNVNGNYAKRNCKWSTRSEQQRNKRCHVA